MRFHRFTNPLHTAVRPLWILTALAILAAAQFFSMPPQVQGQTTPIDYDSDNDGLIEVSSLAQLNAIRWDLDGDGNPDTDVPYGAYTNEQSAAVSKQ